jgi:metal-responsive CopG/Arc/MetJ family transcriptional regulator
MASRKISVSIPEDLADQLDGLPNKSEYVTEALRRRQRADRLEEVFAAHGVTVTEEGKARMRARLAAKTRRRGTENEAA